jgi:hypothetical protein
MKLLPRSLFPVLVLAFVAIVLPSSAQAQAIELKQRWIAGKKYYQSVQTNQQSSFDIGGQKVEQSMKMTMDLTMAVRAHEDGQRKRLTVRYDRVAMDMTVNGQKMAYDSAKPDEGSSALNFGKTMGATVGKELTLLVDAQDRVTEIENYEDFIKQLGSSAVPGMDPRELYSKEAITQMIKQGALQAMPPQAVAPGATWPFVTETVLPKMGKLALRGTYTFKGLADRGGVSCAEILTEATLTMQLGNEAEGGAAKNPMAPLGLKVTDGSLKGTVWFDPALGIAREAQLVQSMKVSMKNPVDQTATIEMPMTQTISQTLTKVEDLK